MQKISSYSIPHLIEVELTYACNSNCIFCYNPRRDSTINYARIDKLIKSIAEARIPHVYLMGGEPSLLKINKLNKYIDLLSHYSSVAMGSNGLIFLENLTENLASISIALHGHKETHEKLTRVKGSYEKVLHSIEGYLNKGFEVRVASTLTAMNYHEMYNIIRTAASLGVGSVFINRFEAGGIGSKLTKKLAPSLKQFKVALTQIITAKKDFGISVGFGSAIPFCIDSRLVDENMLSSCGAGVTFAAVSPNGELRICNQSQKVYGNILNEKIEKIWLSEKLDDFRNLKWVTKPCKNCAHLRSCLCGCKVDTTRAPDSYCVDYAVRDLVKPLCKINKKTNLKISYPPEYRRFKKDKFLKINDYHKEIYIVTKLQTIEIDKNVKKIMKYLLKKTIILEKEIIEKFKDEFKKGELRKLFTKLEMAGALVRI